MDRMAVTHTITNRTINSSVDRINEGLGLRYRTLLSVLMPELDKLAERARRGRPSDHGEDCCPHCCKGHPNTDYIDGIDDLKQLVGDIEPSLRGEHWIDYENSFPDVDDEFTDSYRAGKQLDEMGAPSLLSER